MTKPTPREAGVVLLADGVTPRHLSARVMDGLRSAAVAVVCVLAAAGLRGTLLSQFGTSHVFLTLYGAVMAAALFGGSLSGVLATLLSIIVADYRWTQPIGSLSIADVTDRIETIVFLATGLVVSFCAERVALTRRSLVRRLEVQQQENCGGNLPGVCGSRRNFSGSSKRGPMP